MIDGHYACLRARSIPFYSWTGVGVDDVMRSRMARAAAGVCVTIHWVVRPWAPPAGCEFSEPGAVGHQAEGDIIEVPMEVGG